MIQMEGEADADQAASGELTLITGMFRRLVVCQKWRWPYLHCPSKGIAVHKQTKDDVVHLRRF